MPDVVAAHELLAAARGALGLPASTIDEIFRDAPIDFPVILSRALPLRADLLGMVGITLFGRVYLRPLVLEGDPADLIVLLRHEAEHVRQQREEPLFYLRYLTGWLRGFLGGLAAPGGGGLARRWHRAYMGIPAEQEAYAAGRRAQILVNRK